MVWLFGHWVIGIYLEFEIWLLEFNVLLMVSVAQLDRALGCGPSGRGFESLHSPQSARSSVG